MANETLNFDVSDFTKQVLEKSNTLPVLVDFWAPWCGPCRVLGPILEKLASNNENKWELAKVNVDEHQDIAGEYGVQGIPMVLLFMNGEPVDGFTGALPEPTVEKWLENFFPGKTSKAIEEAQQLFDKGETALAKKKLEDIIMNEPKNQKVKLALAEMIVFTNPEYARELAGKIFEGDELFDRAQAVKILAEMMFTGQQPEELKEGAAKKEYLEAIKALSDRKFDAALEKFIEVLHKDKEYDHEGARRASIAIFHYLGAKHETTLKFRKQFDMALY